MTPAAYLSALGSQSIRPLPTVLLPSSCTSLHTVQELFETTNGCDVCGRKPGDRVATDPKNVRPSASLRRFVPVACDGSAKAAEAMGAYLYRRRANQSDTGLRSKTPVAIGSLPATASRLFVQSSRGIDPPTHRADADLSVNQGDSSVVRLTSVMPGFVRRRPPEILAGSNRLSIEPKAAGGMVFESPGDVRRNPLAAMPRSVNAVAGGERGTRA